MKSRLVHTDCRLYRGDRPCQPHKDEGVICDGCNYYDPIKHRILIIKLGAAGDVLRTTALLPSIREHYPQAHLTWVCGAGSYSLVEHNPLLDRVFVLNAESMILLEQEYFDTVMNFDLDDLATALASHVNAEKRFGYGRSKNGAVYSFTPEGNDYLQMSLWDDFKKANTQTYQTHMHRLAHLPDECHPIMTPLLPEPQQKADAFRKQSSLSGNKPVIGLNVGAGHRWQHKKWTAEGFVELSEKLYKAHEAEILILYGPDDAEQARRVISAMTVPFVDGQARGDVLEFFAVLNLCDIIVTGDTLALHAALGLGKKVICLVGPTSATELDMYGQGEILQGEIDCLGCYLTRCDKDPWCMKLLKAETVFEAVTRYI